MSTAEATAVSRRRTPAWILSVWFHAAAVAAMALARWTVVAPPPVETIASDFAAADEAVLVLPQLGRPESGSPEAVNPMPTPSSSDLAAPLDRLAAASQADSPSSDIATDEPPSGEGSGSGSSGTGSGPLPAFLSGTGAGDRIVYVVDCSKSMRKPFPSPEGNRLGRVKRELLSSIGSLESTQKFFVIFFNDEALPMPGRQYAAGGSRSAERLRPWIARVQGGGQTDPEAALLKALGLRPDAVFFLTDGDFKKSTVDRFVERNRFGTRVHTIGFGDDIRKRHPDSRRRQGPTLAEYLLTDFAKRTNGTVRFIATEPIPGSGQRRRNRTAAR